MERVYVKKEERELTKLVIIIYKFTCFVDFLSDLSMMTKVTAN